MIPITTSTRSLLVRTTQYVTLTPLRRFNRVGPMAQYTYGEQSIPGVGPRPALWEGLAAAKKALGVEELSTAERAAVEAEYQVTLARWQKKATAARKKVQRAHDAMPPGDSRYDVTGSPVLGRNIAARIRIMPEYLQRRLDAIDRRLVKLQAERKALLAQAWDEGHVVGVSDLPTLEKAAHRLNLRAKSRNMGLSKELDHTDTVWPASLNIDRKTA